MKKLHTLTTTVSLIAVLALLTVVIKNEQPAFDSAAQRGPAGLNKLPQYYVEYATALAAEHTIRTASKAKYDEYTSARIPEQTKRELLSFVTADIEASEKRIAYLSERLNSLPLED